MAEGVLRLGKRITLFPVVHGSGDFAVEIRRRLLAESFECLAVPLPPSFQQPVENAIIALPQPLLVVQEPLPEWVREQELSQDDQEGGGRQEVASYVPVEPCQPVVAALRLAMEEHMARAFIDLETESFQPFSTVFPDPYALKRVPLERYAAALLPFLGKPASPQFRHRMARMAAELRRLERRFERIAAICSLVEWPWLRLAYLERWEDPPDETTGAVETYEPDRRTLLFMLGELPFITALYERARSELDDDTNLSIDGVKELLLAARESYQREFGNRARRITPHLLSLMLKYIRNLSLIEKRFTPDLYTLVVAAQQVAGDSFALHVVERAREYPYCRNTGHDSIALGVNQARLSDGRVVKLVSRLPGPPVVWRNYSLKRRPDKSEVRKWRMAWDPYGQCSYPPEDEAIESFRAHLFDRARQVAGMDLVRTEKFTTSIKDGIDIRETLRHWYSGEIYVKVLPPSRGKLDCAVMFFEYPADPRDYPWRTTWYAEHEDESTLAFYATSYLQEVVGPGIARATYGGALFLYPPRPIVDIWQDPRLDFAETLEERLLAAACLHAQHRLIAVLSPVPVGAGWRRLARRFGKKFIHLPLSQFSESTIQKLRTVHVLQGKYVRSYAAHYIRRP
ncbi:MAG: hypothetical protein KatS3mg110_3968 [Pirellulaceae bacterium]|nr:MAG: hypothetical protein KatS3mg110_3968 [Pirellulaceae bacterium]